MTKMLTETQQEAIETADERLGRFRVLEDHQNAAANAINMARSVLKMLASAIHGGAPGEEGDRLNTLDAADRFIGEAEEALSNMEFPLGRFIKEQRAAAEAEAASPAKVITIAAKVARRSRKAVRRG